MITGNDKFVRAWSLLAILLNFLLVDYFTFALKLRECCKIGGSHDCTDQYQLPTKNMQKTFKQLGLWLQMQFDEVVPNINKDITEVRKIYEKRCIWNGHLQGDK